MTPVASILSQALRSANDGLAALLLTASILAFIILSAAASVGPLVI